MKIKSKDWYIQGNTVEIDDLNVFYKRSGMGPTLLCIHGFPTSSWDFAEIWPELTSHFDAITSDLIGLGRSAKPRQSITVAYQADIIEKLLLALDIKEAHILAHDLGDTVAQELLARQSENKSPVKWLSCIMMNGGIFHETHRPRLIQRLLLSPIGPWIAKSTTEATYHRNMKNIFSKQHPPVEEFLTDSWMLITENDGISMIPRVIQYMKERVTYRERWISPLVYPTVPIRLINGALDPISGQHMADRFDELVPDADIVSILDAGHYPHLESPEQVLEAILKFHNKIYQTKME